MKSDTTKAIPHTHADAYYDLKGAAMRIDRTGNIDEISRDTIGRVLRFLAGKVRK